MFLRLRVLSVQKAAKSEFISLSENQPDSCLKQMLHKIDQKHKIKAHKAATQL